MLFYNALHILCVHCRVIVHVLIIFLMSVSCACFNFQLGVVYTCLVIVYWVICSVTEGLWSYL